MKIIRPGDLDLARSVHRFQCKECLCIFEAGRCWTSRPTDEQREAVKWDD